MTGQGNPLPDNGGNEINIPTNSGRVEINADGTIAVGGGVIAKVGLVNFEDEQQLRRSANNLYIAPDEATPQEVEKPKIVQGMLEQSNVNAIEQFTQMIQIHRSNNSLDRGMKQEHERIMKMISRLTRRASAA